MRLLLITLLPLSSLAGPAPFFPSSLSLPAPGLVQYSEVAALQYCTVLYCNVMYCTIGGRAAVPPVRARRLPEEPGQG